MHIDIEGIRQFLLVSFLPLAGRVGLKLVAAAAAWVIGRRVIRWLLDRLDRTPRTRSFDPTLARYITSALAALLTACLVVGIAGFLGIETASFAALLAGVGLAIGTAWGDLLKSFAAGIFLLGLRPFRVGDEVTMAGVTGRVEEIGIFVCVVRTHEHVQVTIPNSKIFAENIHNFTQPPLRRLELRVQLGHNRDHHRARALILEALAGVKDVAPSPAPRVDLIEITPAGPVLSARPFCPDPAASEVTTACNQAILDVLTAAGFFAAPAPASPAPAPASGPAPAPAPVKAQPAPA